MTGRIESPYDPQARFSTKRSVDWVGYKVHLTETCDAGLPRLLTHVETVEASASDARALPDVHAALATRGLLPAEHLVDQGYTGGEVLLESARRDGVRVIGPVAEDCSWQGRAGKGFDKAHFIIDWDARSVTCPAGHQSHTWIDKTGVPGMVAEARFSAHDCRPCPHRGDCTKSKKAFRNVTIQERDRYEALQAARQAQNDETFPQKYALRAGVESTHEQAVRRCGLRHCRYIGLDKTRLQHVATAAALNLIRLAEWMCGIPLAPTRRSRFAVLQVPV